GHAAPPEELGAAGYDNGYESVGNGLEELRQYGEPNVVVGLSAGAVLAARLAADQSEAVAGLAMLAPAFFLPTSTTIMLRGVRGILGSFVDRIYLLNPGGSDIHDAIARSIHPSCRLVPLSAPMKLLDLSAVVKPMLAHIAQPALEESYHVITVDSEKERVAGEVIEFVERFRAAPQKRAAG